MPEYLFAQDGEVVSSPGNLMVELGMNWSPCPNLSPNCLQSYF